MSNSEFITLAQHEQEEVLFDSGGTCDCYRLVKDNRVYCVKRPKKDLRSSEVYMNLFRKEFELGIELEHPFGHLRGERFDPLVEQRVFDITVVVGLAEGGNIASEALAEVMDEAHADHFVVVGLGKNVLQEHGHQGDTPTVFCHTLHPSLRSGAMTRCILEPFGHMQYFKKFSGKHDWK